MMGCGRRRLRQGRDEKHILMGIYMRENFKIVSRTGKAFLSGSMERFMMENGRADIRKGIGLGKMIREIFTKEIGKEERLRARDFKDGEMVIIKSFSEEEE